MGSVMDYVMMELRLLRQTLGLSQEEFGRSIGYSASHVSSVETGGRSLTPDYAVALDRAYDPAFRESEDGRFGRMLRELSEFDPDWLREWIEYEQQAKLLRWYEPAFVPGLLQTEAYARAMFTTDILPPADVDQRVKSRLARQAILTREAAVPLVAVLDVMVLRRQVVGQPGVMAEQVAHLVKMAELPHVQILVVPEEAGIYPGLQGGFILATLGDGSMVTHLDHQVRAQVVNGADDLATLQRTWEAVRGEALPRRQSLDLIKRRRRHGHDWCAVAQINAVRHQRRVVRRGGRQPAQRCARTRHQGPGRRHPPVQPDGVAGLRRLRQATLTSTKVGPGPHGAGPSCWG